MKKTTYILAAALCALAFSCTREAVPSTASEQQQKGTITTFVVDNATKITVSEKSGSVYNALWAEGDTLAIVAADGGSVLGTAKLSSGAGTASGVFTTTAQIADGTSIKLVYGTPIIPADQTQACVGEINLDGVSYAASEAVAFSAGSTTSFTLVHTPALVKVKVSSTEFAGLSLKGVAIYSAGKTLAAEAEPYAEVTFAKPALLADAQEAWLSVNPVTEKADFYVAAIMTGEVDKVADATVSIPVKFEGKTLEGGKVNVISLENLTTASNAIPWYEPVCTRYIPLKGWAYGKSNTVLVDPEANSSVQFSVKAEGDVVNVLRYAKEPKHLKCRIADQVNTGTWKSWKIEETKSSNAGVIALKSLTPTIGRSDEAIASSKTAVCGFFDLLDADKNVIWSYSFWASKVASHTYKCGVDVMDQTLGAENPVSVGATSAKARNRGTYYQWGRPFPFGYGTALQLYDKEMRINSLAASANKSNYFAQVVDENNTTDWFTPETKGDTHNDFWGNPSTDENSTDGTKSIFDPCPKGWMVCCPAVLKEVADGGTLVKSPCNGISYKIDDSWSDFYDCGAFYNGTLGAQGGGNRGSDKGLYFSNIGSTGENAFYMEIASDITSVKTTTTWRSNACSVRCMKDTENR